uniref:Uncharacterized protein n=1 Tax=Ananas comosus var. bracteatus TaxID=296719 RepID=A0A6V7Q337_ANACO|nr:unnamed protein product [Ananas comosus var. bracteatus]
MRSRPSPKPLSFLFFFFFIYASLNLLSSSSSPASSPAAAAAVVVGVVGGGDGDGGAAVMRASFAVDGDVAWAVQISDLHVSAHHPARARDLVRLLAPALRLLRPSLLLITGDLTDAKNKKRTSTRQDEYEWILYRNSMDEVVKQSGLDKHRIFDIRGNHDKYGVPFVGHKMDFFSTHSINSQLNRLSTIYSISLLGNDRRYLFIGIDDTMSIGIRGHPTCLWELGDWKESKLIRILALDGEAVSFLDLELEQEFPTTILITYPTDSRSMNTITTDRHSIRNDISALVFSHYIILNVTAKVFDSSRNFKIVEEIPLQLVTSSSSTVYKPLFHAKWNAESYKSTSPTRYWVQVFALDSQGKQILSEPRPFSVDGKLVGFSLQRQQEIKVLKKSGQFEHGIKTTLGKDCILRVYLGGGARKILLFLCMIISLVHCKICTALMWAYGAAPVALSPALCWVPPLLLVAAVYSTATTAE